MEKESFRILKEINSLHLKNQQLSDQIENENQRVAKINKHRENKNFELLELEKLVKEKRAALALLENAVSKIYTQIEQTKSHINNVFTDQELSALQKQLQNLEEQLEINETQTFELMQELEAYEDNLKETKTFLEGSLETLVEIQEEVLAAIKPYQDEQVILNKRIEQLYSELPQEAQDKLKSIIAKKLALSPLAQIDQKRCSICHFQLDQMLIDDVEKQHKLKTCTACSRILIPINALY